MDLNDDLPDLLKSLDATIDEFGEMPNHFVDHCTCNLPSVVWTLLRKRRSDGGPLLALAGGFIRDSINGTRASDIDLFVLAEERAAKGIAVDLFGGLATDITDNAVKMDVALRHATESNGIGVGQRPIEMKLSIVYRWPKQTPRDLIDGFDFTCCKAAIWIGDGGRLESLAAQNFVCDARNKLLTFAPGEQIRDSAAASLLRLERFVQRGYKADAHEMLKICAARYSELHEQFDGDVPPDVFASQFFVRADGTLIDGNS